jgi:DNA-binding CsgD family transcriptional regulator
MTAATRNDDLLSHLYDAVMAPAGFQCFIDKLVEVFQLKAVTMVIRNGETQEVKGLWLSGMSKEWMETYALDYAREDMLAQHITISPIAHFYASNLDVANADTFAETRFYNEFLVPQGIAYATGAIVLQEGPWLTQLFLQRAPFHTPFVREEMDQLNQLMPHLQRAIQMRQRFTELQFGQNFLAGGLDVLAMPTFLFDEYGRVVHYNRSATDFLADRSNMWLDNGHLQTADSATTRKLGVEISKALHASRGGSDLNSPVLLSRDGHLPLMLMIAPLHLPTAPTTQAAALLFAFDPEAAPSVTIDLVRRLFGLSEAEAELSVALCCGKTMDDVASERGTSPNTIKSQLKSVFLKTGTKRQSELVSLLLASPAYFLAQKQDSGGSSVQ